MIFLKKNLEDISPFVGPLIPSFLTSGDVCPGFQSQGGSLFVCFLTCVIIISTSDATPADCIDVSMAAKLFQSMYLQTCLEALVDFRGLNS